MNRTARSASVLVLEDEWLITEEIDMALNAAGCDVIGSVAQVRDAMEQRPKA